MKSSLHCLPCFLQQTIKAARLSTTDPVLQKKILDTIALLLPDLDLQKSPPENSIPVYETIAQISGCPDPFADLKKQSNSFALGLVDHVRKKITAHPDPLYAALLFSIAGNIIDYGSQQDFDAEAALATCLDTVLTINDYQNLRQNIEKSTLLLYLGDNAGEIVFDSLVIETLKEMFPDLEIVYVVKASPIINDALMDDADSCGLPQLCRVIVNGTGCPGTPLANCSPEFQELFTRADVIISKGQGNYETLSETTAPIYFLLTVKCPIVGAHLQEQNTIAVRKGDLVLMRAPKKPMVKE
ncbi:MAG: DUF89 family protein [Proteobacteria bacterium]|nr:DUF89 family protein [Pseudomonadota bacterium]MBU1640250.1 DUF89 family protein [Pseudomonadota bacterium]